MSERERASIERLTTEQVDLLWQLLDDRIERLRNQVRVQDELSVPCAPGSWRWADVKPGGYGRKSEDDLAGDRAKAAERAARARRELEVALETRQTLITQPQVGKPCNER